jgi:hypothetical protein
VRVDRTRTAPRHAAHRSRQVRGRHSSPQRAQLTSLAPRAERRASRPNSAHARRQRVLSWAERALRGYRFGDEALVRSGRAELTSDARLCGAGQHRRRVNLIERQRDHRESGAVSCARAPQRPGACPSSLLSFTADPAPDTRDPALPRLIAGSVRRARCIGTHQDLPTATWALQPATGEPLGPLAFGRRRSSAATPIGADRRDWKVAIALARHSAVSDAKAIASVMLAFRAFEGSSCLRPDARRQVKAGPATVAVSVPLTRPQRVRLAVFGAAAC